ncbi:MAG: tRNA (adenosine(37)-N6)-dimethylallyltransferase MiaA [bacterium]|mgnify:CR=1 FL=1|nr:tRNA (adenosine(37)-N6)-dimethylallyltransferase MiaA [Bacillota bacterium]HHW55329.1 tRNA (adenosine(37)-N6)-dimethylallyltransferase MiaA [Bacillota bacterium]
MKIPLLVIVGPTAVGKTKTAIQVAHRLQGEVVSADSRQVYRYMDIGTAKPDWEEREGIPHHLIDIVNPDEEFSVADYQRLAQRVIRDIWERNKLPILAGGTGFYINAVIDNYNFSSTAVNREFRQRMRKLGEKYGGAYLLEKLRGVDPVAAERLHPNDLRRIIRALEVYEYTGRPISQWEREQDKESPYLLYIAGLTMDRTSLYSLINERVERMIARGLVDEVRDLLARGYSPDLNSMQGLGYKEIIPYLEGKVSLEEAVEILQRNTRRFAKRQLTWFRRDRRINWYHISMPPGEKLMEDIASTAAGKLGLAANKL